MRVISRGTLREFWTKHPKAEGPLKAWHAEAVKARWESPQDIKNRYRSADFVGKDRVVFDIGGNNYRLVVAIDYARYTVFIKFVGTHAEYDKIDVATVSSTGKP